MIQQKQKQFFHVSAIIAEHIFLNNYLKLEGKTET